MPTVNAPRSLASGGRTRLQDVMWSLFAAHPLTLASERIRPGMLLETKWLPSLELNSRPRFLREDGYAWEALRLDADDPAQLAPYATHMYDAGVLVGALTQHIVIGYGFPYAHYGLAISGTLQRELTCTIDIETVTVRTFERGFAGHDLRRRLRQLKSSTNSRSWRWVNDDFLVTDAYHTSNLRFTFQTKGNLSARALLETAGLAPVAQASLHWEHDDAFILQGAASAPFAVRGMKV